MPVSLNEGMESVAELALADFTKDPFFVRCKCGQMWSLTMERGGKGPGYIPCSCGIELVVWSGTVAFSASLVKSSA